MSTPREVWLRGPIAGVPPALQPAAHALVQVQEDLAEVLPGMSSTDVWRPVGGGASIGFHARHLAGSLDRLLTYARGEQLDDRRRAALAAEKSPGVSSVDGAALLALIAAAVAAAVEQMRRTRPESLSDAREVGRARLPSTVQGLLFHAAEHAARHTGQIITTALVLRGTSPKPESA